MEALLDKTQNSKKESVPTLLTLCLNSFEYFFFQAFSIAINRVEGKYVTPHHLREVADRLQYYDRTSTIAPRFHLKSTIVEAYVAWKLLRMEQNWNEWIYMSYTGDLAAYHTKRLKRYISALPELFGELMNCTDSESILFYKNKQGKTFHCEPVGILTFQRGKHPNGMILDDILRDPQVKLDLTQIEKITHTFFEEIEQMPKEELHLVGTPQDQEDLFAQLESKSDYNSKRYDIIVDAVKKQTLWQLCYDWDWAENRRLRIGDKAFMKEFRCMPVRGMEGFISLNQLNFIINKRLKNYDVVRPPVLKERTVVGGFDIGKKTHPSHLCVLVEYIKGSFRKLVQIHSKFMDGWAYTDQIEYLRQAIEVFKMDTLYYDDTRAEFEASYEQGILPGEMKGITFSAKSKFTMATELDKVITNKAIELIANDRQKRQILTVDCDLKAPETDEGHGDSFFSLCLAVQAWADNKGDVAWVA
jgi:hypothetical protein